MSVACRTCARPARPVTRITISLTSIRTISATQPRKMSSSLPPVTPPLSERLPSDSFHLISEAEKPGSYEDALYNQQLKDVEAWWATSRYEGIKRPYTVEDVVSKRGSLQQSYPSSVMARKLWNLIQERLAKGEPLHTSMFSRLVAFLSRVISNRHSPQWAPSTLSK